MRVGWGVDAHRYGGSPPTLLAGVVADETRSIAATSDGDVPAHAVADRPAINITAQPRMISEFFRIVVPPLP